MKVKSAELIGPALNWAVAQCEGWERYDDETGLPIIQHQRRFFEPYEPSTDWSQGGPIIEREGISVGDPSHFDDYGSKDPFIAVKGFIEDEGGERLGRGKTYLIAAMRCHVISKLGEEVEIPNNICSQ